MFKLKSLLFVTLFAFAACSQGARALYTYQKDGETVKITISEAVSRVTGYYIDNAERINYEEFEAWLTNGTNLQYLTDNQTLEQDLFILYADNKYGFTTNESYVQAMEQQNQVLAPQLTFQIAFREGLKKINERVNEQRVAFAEISRIMVTNAESLVSLENILTNLSASTNVVADFTAAAIDFSQEDIGQYGGYINMVTSTQDILTPNLKDVIFKEKAEGLYPEIIQDGDNYYVLLVHTKAQEGTVNELAERNPMLTSEAQNTYINSNIEYLFSFDGTNVTIGRDSFPVADIRANANILRIWNRSYSLEDIKEAIGNPNVGDTEILSALAPVNDEASQFVQELAIYYRGWTSSIRNSEEFKQLERNEINKIALTEVSGYIENEFIQEYSTNVTDQEVQEFYGDTENLLALGITPGEGQFPENIDMQNTQLVEYVKNLVITQRFQVFRSNLNAQLMEEYEAELNEDSLPIYERKVLSKLAELAQQ